MYALIDERAAAFARPAGSPSAHVVIVLRTVPVRNNEIYSLYGAYLSLVYKLLCFCIHSVGALIEHHRAYKVGFFYKYFPQAFRLFDGYADRLFYKKIHIPVCAVLRYLDMRVMRRRDDYAVGLFLIEHLNSVGIAFYFILGAKRVEHAFVRIAHGDKHSMFYYAFENIAGVPSAHSAYTDYRKSFHISPTVIVV